MRSRLLLLVVASVVPLVCLGVAREYLDYRADRISVYDGLMLTARSMAVAVERELQMHVSSLETLATSPALQAPELAGFDEQAHTFLARQPPGTILGLSAPGSTPLRVYGLAGGVAHPVAHSDAMRLNTAVFATGQPTVTDLTQDIGSGGFGFSVDVPVFRDSKVIYDLFIRLRPTSINDLIARQHLPPRHILSVADSTGHVVARFPGADRYVGNHSVPTLWQAISSHSEGLVEAPALEGYPAIIAYAHVTPFSWAVVVGAPQDVILQPARAAIIRVGVTGGIVLAVGLLLAMVAARGITRPIEHLRRLATAPDRAEHFDFATTGLPETDTVASALLTAAADRQAAAGALAESESRFRALFEQSASGTILVDPETTQVIDGNEVAASIVGCTVEEFRTHLITDFALGTRPERIHEINRAVVDGATFRYETRLNGLNGPRDVFVAVAPVKVAGRTLVLVNQIDITDLRKAQAGFRANEERLELAREGANLGIWDWDLANDTLSWSDHQWYLHGLERQPNGPSPTVWRRAIHPADRDRVVRDLIAALKSPGWPYATEYSVVLPDGSIRRLLARGQTIRGADGRTVRMVGINMDVTARYEAEKARDELILMLQGERSRLAEIIEALPIGVGIVDATGRILTGNALITRLNGQVIQSMTSQPQGEWFAFDADGNRIEPVNYPIRRALREGVTTFPGIEFLYRDPAGHETWYRVASLPLRHEAGQVVEALAIFQDVDAEKRLLDIQQQINAELEQRVREEMAAREAAQQRAAHAERMHALGQIAGGIAHDFNNVLQAVSGGAALIERRPDDPARVLRHVRMVTDAARRGAAITSRLLAFSRRGDLRAENVDAAALLTDMNEVLTHTLGGSVVCVVQTSPNLPPLFADRGQLETVIVNLATNARDAMPAGGTLTMAADTDTVPPDLVHPAGLAPGNYVRIMISDTGTGMDQAVLSRVTEPFFTTKAPGKGTGLGLAMAKGFVEQSGGSLLIDSTVGLGTCITLWLPAATETAAHVREQEAAGRTVTDQPRVLLVDDDAIVREVLKHALEESGYTVHAASGGAAGLSWLESGEHADIIVSDLTMPGMDGLMLIRAAQTLRPNLPAILLTGYAGDGASLAVGGAISGTFSLLRKPISGTQLADRINALLLSRRQASGA